MRDIIVSVNLKRSKYIFITIVAFIMFLPIYMASFNRNNAGNNETNSTLQNQEFYLDDSSIRFDEGRIIKDSINVDTVKVYRAKEKKIEEIKIEEYLIGVLSGEMPASFEIEALKAQAVAARTYTLAHIRSLGGSGCSLSAEADLCDTEDCQVYKTKEDRFNDWPEGQKEELWNKLGKAVKETEGQILTYNGEIVMSPLYFAVSSGKTEDSVEVFGGSRPYLKSVDSPGEEISDKYKTVTVIENTKVSKLINSKYTNSNIKSSNLKKQIKILEKSEAGGVTRIKVGNIEIKGSEFRALLGLNSTNFSIKYNKSSMEITCLGYGHGVGMSQWGANVMAKDGKGYVEILTHYYQGTKVEKINNN